MVIKREENMLVCLLDENKIGRIDFQITDKYIDASYIFVDPENRGTNAKNMLLDELMKMSDELNLKINATCSYMNGWFYKNNKEYLV